MGGSYRFWQELGIQLRCGSGRDAGNGSSAGQGDPRVQVQQQNELAFRAPRFILNTGTLPRML